MVISSHLQPNAPPQLVEYLQKKIGLSEKALTLGLRHSELEQAPLPIVLWSFGLISLCQYEMILDWQQLHL